MENKVEKKSARQWKLPHLFTILIAIIIVCGILTYIIPAGQYERVEFNGRMVINAERFEFIEQTPVPMFDWAKAVPKGIISSISLIIFIFIAVGSLGVYMDTGVFQKAMSGIIRKSSDKSIYIMMIIIMSFFAIDSGYAGIFDGHIPYVPLAIGFSLAAGFDLMTGLAMVMVPTYVAFSIGPASPNPLAVAQGIAGLPTFSGIQVRTFILVLFMAVSYFFIIRYASKVKKDKSLSLTNDIDVSSFIFDDKEEKMSVKDIVIILLLCATIAMNVYGGLKLGWYVVEMTALFLISGIVAGLIARYDNHKIVDIFVKNAKEVFVGAMCIGVARGITIVLTDGNIIDSIIYYAASVLQNVPSSLAAVGMFFLQFLFNFIVPSGSGQAAITMPILAPIGDILGVTRQTTVLAFQFGDGLCNLIAPTVGTTFAFLGIAKLSFNKFLKFVAPLTIILVVMATVTVFVAAKMNFGPF